MIFTEISFIDHSISWKFNNICMCLWLEGNYTEFLHTHTHLNTLSWSQLSAIEYSQAGLKLRQLKKTMKILNKLRSYIIL